MGDTAPPKGVPRESEVIAPLPATWYDLSQEGRLKVAIAIAGTTATTVLVSGMVAISMGHYTGGTISAFGIYQPEAIIFTAGLGTVAALLAVHNNQTALHYEEVHIHSRQGAILNPIAHGLGTIASVALCVVAVKPLMTGLTVSRLHIVCASIFFYGQALRNVALTTIQLEDAELRPNAPFAIALDVAAVAAILYMPFAIAGATGGMSGSTAALAAQTVGGAALLLHPATTLEEEEPLK